MRKGEVLKFLHEEIICSNKKDTSNFQGTVSFDPIKMSQKKKCLSNVRHTKVGNHFILFSYLEELLNLIVGEPR